MLWAKRLGVDSKGMVRSRKDFLSSRAKELTETKATK